jgi:hypothetical protein
VTLVSEENKKEKRQVIDVKTNETLLVDVDASRLVSDVDQEKRTIIYKRKVEPYVNDIIKWRHSGKGAVQIAELLDINPSTFYIYRKNVPELQEAWDLGTELLGDAIEHSMFDEAKGYTYEEDALTKTGRVVTLKKYARGSVPAAKLVLPTLKPKSYKKDYNATGEVGGITLEAIRAITAADIRKLLANGKKETESDGETTKEE